MSLLTGRRRTFAVGFGATVLTIVAVTDTVTASNIAAGLGNRQTITVPTWLTLLTGSAAVGASALLAALVTDRRFVDALHNWERPLTSPSLFRRDDDTDRSGKASFPRSGIAIWSAVGSVLGILAFVGVVLAGLVGPTVPTANLAILLPFVGLRAMLPMIAFLVVNPWPVIDPFRTIATGVNTLLTRVRPHSTGGERHEAARAGLLEYPTWLASWPAVIGLAVLIWLELVLPVTTDPRVLTFLAVGYAGYTVIGSVLFSPATWIRQADPLATLFRLYGAVAPIQHRNGRTRLVVPGARLRDGDVVPDLSTVAFVILVVWELTFNGFVVTPPGSWTITTLVATGIPATVAYLLVLLGGYALALGLYLLAARLSRRVAPTYLTERVLVQRFAPPLLAIAAGYHLAHYLAFAISLAPATLAVVMNPLSPPVNPTTLVTPDWMRTLEIGMLLLGHLLAIWAAHATAFDLFPGRLQAIRSQYPFVVVMICYTAVSLWVLTLPTGQPPYVAG